MLSEAGVNRWEDIVLVGPHVLIKRDPEIETTKGGIILPRTARELSMWAKVLAVGWRRSKKTGERVPLPIIPGNYVLFDTMIDYRTLLIQGEEYQILDEDDCFLEIDLEGATWQ